MFKRISELLEHQDEAELPVYHEIRQQHKNLDELTRVAQEYLNYKKGLPGNKRLVPSSQQTQIRGNQVAAWKLHQQSMPHGFHFHQRKEAQQENRKSLSSFDNQNGQLKETTKKQKMAKPSTAVGRPKKRVLGSQFKISKQKKAEFNPLMYHTIAAYEQQPHGASQPISHHNSQLNQSAGEQVIPTLKSLSKLSDDKRQQHFVHNNRAFKNNFTRLKSAVIHSSVPHPKSPERLNMNKHVASSIQLEDDPTKVVNDHTSEATPIGQSKSSLVKGYFGNPNLKHLDLMSPKQNRNTDLNSKSGAATASLNQPRSQESNTNNPYRTATINHDRIQEFRGHEHTLSSGKLKHSKFHVERNEETLDEEEGDFIQHLSSSLTNQEKVQAIKPIEPKSSIQVYPQVQRSHQKPQKRLIQIQTTYFQMPPQHIVQSKQLDLDTISYDQATSTGELTFHGNRGGHIYPQKSKFFPQQQQQQPQLVLQQHDSQKSLKSLRTSNRTDQFTQYPLRHPPAILPNQSENRNIFLPFGERKKSSSKQFFLNESNKSQVAEEERGSDNCQSSILNAPASSSNNAREVGLQQQFQKTAVRVSGDVELSLRQLHEDPPRPKQPRPQTSHPAGSRKMRGTGYYHGQENGDIFTNKELVRQKRCLKKNQVILQTINFGQFIDHMDKISSEKPSTKNSSAAAALAKIKPRVEVNAVVPTTAITGEYSDLHMDTIRKYPGPNIPGGFSNSMTSLPGQQPAEKKVQLRKTLRARQIYQHSASIKSRYKKARQQIQQQQQQPPFISENQHAYTIPNSPRRSTKALKASEKSRQALLIQGGKAELAKAAPVVRSKKMQQMKNSAPFLHDVHAASSQGTLKQSTTNLTRFLGPSEMLLGSCNIINNRLMTRQSIFQKRQLAGGAKMRSSVTSSASRPISSNPGSSHRSKVNTPRKEGQTAPVGQAKERSDIIQIQANTSPATNTPQRAQESRTGRQNVQLVKSRKSSFYKSLPGQRRQSNNGSMQSKNEGLAPLATKRDSENQVDMSFEKQANAQQLTSTSQMQELMNTSQNNLSQDNTQEMIRMKMTGRFNDDAPILDTGEGIDTTQSPIANIHDTSSTNIQKVCLNIGLRSRRAGASGAYDIDQQKQLNLFPPSRHEGDLGGLSRGLSQGLSRGDVSSALPREEIQNTEGFPHLSP